MWDYIKSLYWDKLTPGKKRRLQETIRNFAPIVFLLFIIFALILSESL